MHAIFQGTTVIPVVTIGRAVDAVPLATALLRAGLRVVEVTLRTPEAAGAIREIARRVPDVIVGAGTVLTGADVTRAVEAGARFLVSPGLTPDLVAAGLASELPYVPGAVTPSEVIAAREHGFSLLKFFPAAASGGTEALRQLAPVFPGIAFCPTGGVGEANATEYLSLPNVPMVGGSWMASSDAIAAGDWAGIEERARRAVRLKPR
ncbi:MAG TPA: bifunctional 4-hydroxy-2-oxoglutarate aldolase/2-dehydro-3-deoxy-phosphogluconate aldolase [Stellaceae bacterium]|nr:bifunctional 4-hydroxy-2-oxoglutarate aldolase/2-dehydro-3-deoxy-phosphogluconate aldolase [Stellaceae bacterium]